jgi:hypothetical protein
MALITNAEEYACSWRWGVVFLFHVVQDGFTSAMAKRHFPLLGAVHRGIRRFYECIGFRAIRRVEGEADTHANIHDLPGTAELERLIECRSDFVGDSFGFPAVFDCGQDNGKFITPDASDGIGVAYLAPDPHGDCFQEFVAGGVAEPVVHWFEFVEV